MRQSAFVGKLLHAPKLARTQTGTPVLNLELLDRERQGETWVEHKFKIVVWGTSAERIARIAKEGSEIVAFCRPEGREYRDSQGRTRRSEDHVASWIRVCVEDGAEGGTHAG